MHAEVIPEPELEFGGGGRHVDPRFGIATYGPADLTAGDAPRAIRIGLIGPADQLPGLRAWLERCREPIAAKDERYPHLFPGFPGCEIDCGMHTILVFSDRHTRALSDRVPRSITDAPAAHGLAAAVEVYAAEITAMAEVKMNHGIREGHAQENLAVLRHLTLNLLRREKTAHVGIKVKRLKAAWDTNYLQRILETAI